MYYHLLRWFPHNAFSRMMGALAGRRWPGWLLGPVIRLYIALFKIEMEQFEGSPGEFATFNEFFARPLKPGARPIADGAGQAVSPVDGRVVSSGKITQGRLIQAKGRDYSLSELLGGDPVWEEYKGGSFITLYLSPRDYHRIHSPAAGKVTRFIYLPGELWSVSPAGVSNVPRLFSRNERLITVLESDMGEMLLVAVGATVVGRIRVLYHPVVSNIKGASPLSETLAAPYPVEKGDELGRFELGSTVIMLFRPGQAELGGFQPGDPLKMGEPLARLLNPDIS